MANNITKHIPNTITCLNLFSGCIAAMAGFGGNYQLALAFIILGAVFDFFDGMAARALDAHSVIGKDIDSLADDITFGLAPAAMAFSLLNEMFAGMDAPYSFLPFAAFLIAVFSGLRLAKFNNDSRQTTSFIGLPVPANALFWGSLIVGHHQELLSCSFAPAAVLVLVLFTSWLLVSEIPMFSLKFKSLAWKDNKVRYLFLIGCLPLLFFFRLSGIACIIVWFVILSIVTQHRQQS